MLNKITIIGNVGKDPEMRFTPNGSPVTSFSVAAGRAYTTSGGERKDDTQWFTVVAWNKLAETCNQYINKGQQVYVEGKLQVREWEGQDGKTHYRTEIVANQVLFLGKRNKDSYDRAVESKDDDELEIDDIPF